MKKNIPFEYPVNPYDPFYDAYFSPLIKDTPANRWAIYCALRNSNPKLEEEKTIYRKSKEKFNTEEAIDKLTKNLQKILHRHACEKPYSKMALIKKAALTRFQYRSVEKIIDPLNIDWNLQAKRRALECLKENMNFEQVKEQLKIDLFEDAQISCAISFLENKNNQKALKKACRCLEEGYDLEDIVDELEFEGYSEDEILYALNGIEEDL